MLAVKCILFLRKVLDKCFKQYFWKIAALCFEMLSILEIHYFVLVVNLPAKMLLKILFGFLSKLLASLMRNNFPKRPSGAPLHTLSKLYDVPVGFVNPPPLI